VVWTFLLTLISRGFFALGVGLLIGNSFKGSPTSSSALVRFRDREAAEEEAEIVDVADRDDDGVRRGDVAFRGGITDEEDADFRGDAVVVRDDAVERDVDAVERDVDAEMVLPFLTGRRSIVSSSSSSSSSSNGSTVFLTGFFRPAAVFAAAVVVFFVAGGKAIDMESSPSLSDSEDGNTALFFDAFDGAFGADLAAVLPERFEAEVEEEEAEAATPKSMAASEEIP